MVKIKRENWDGEFRTVARDKGKIVASKKWSPKFTIEKAKRIYKQNRTFRKDVEKIRLTKVSEVVDYSGMKPRRAVADKYQYFISALIKNKNIVARSQSKHLDFPKSKARQEALGSFYERVAEAEGLEYDEEIGKEFFEKQNLRFREGVVYYQAI